MGNAPSCMYTIRNARALAHTRYTYAHVHLYLLWFRNETNKTNYSLRGGVDWSKIIKNERKFILEVSTVAINLEKNL